MKKKKYKHTTKHERQDIDYHLRKKCGINEIANKLGRSPSTILEEIRNNSVNDKYNWKKAHHKAYVRRKYSKYQGMKVVEHEDLLKYVEENTKKGWSPKVMAGRIKYWDRHITYASKNAIYTFIHSVYGRKLEPLLAYKGKKYQRISKTILKKLKNRTFIDKRPKSVEDRKYFGDWEGDFIVSGKNGSGVLLVLVERKSRYVIIIRLKNRNNDLVNKAIQKTIGGMIYFNTLTLDNDIAFSKHIELSRMIKSDVYFCHSYHSWEKGSVENMNKLIRRYIKKGSDISSYTDEYIQWIQDRLNNTPREILKYKKPIELMNESYELKSKIGRIQLEAVLLNKKQTEYSA